MQGQKHPQAGQGYPSTVQWYPPTLVIAEPPRQNKVENYNCGLALKLGICQIILGSLIIIFNIVAYVVQSPITNVIFFGIMIILAGSFEVTSAKNNTRCWVITTMVFAILAAIFAASAVITPSIALGINGGGRNSEGRYVVNGVLVVLALIEFVIAILAGALTCKGYCCVNNPHLVQQSGVIFSQPIQYEQSVMETQVVFQGQHGVGPTPPPYTYQIGAFAPPAYQPPAEPYSSATPSDPEAKNKSKRDLP